MKTNSVSIISASRSSFQSTRRYLARFIVFLVVLTPAAWAQSIPNPSFESNNFTVYPGYVNSNGGIISSWVHSPAINRVGLNPSGGNPFANNGLASGNVAFIQSAYNEASSLSTTITGLSADSTYSVTFRANCRSSAAAPSASWSLNSGPFVSFTAYPAVGGANPYRYVSGIFTATATTAEITIRNVSAGDSALLVDSFTIANVNGIPTFNYTDNGSTITIDRYNNTALGSVVIPDTIDGKPVTSIGDSAFSGLALTGVSIPASVTSIGDSAFADCDFLTGVTVPASVASIGDFAFADCNSLQYINVSGGNPTYWSWDGVLYQIIPITLHRDLIQCPGGLAGFQFPGLVDDIHDYALANCDKLTSVYIPEGIRNIGRGAFISCSGLTSATFLGDAPLLGSGAFSETQASFRVYYDFWWYGFQDVPWNEYTAVKPASPEVSVQHPVGYNVVDGSYLEFRGKPFVVEMTGNTAETYTIQNTGSANLLGLAIIKGGANPGDFTISALRANMLAPGASTSFTVTFVPTALGERSAWIQIASNDADESPFEITFGGTGTVTNVNDAPTISDVTDKSTSEDIATSAIAFTIGDIDTPIGSLTLSAGSSNIALVPLANVVLGGSGANRTVTITPAAGQSGIATITLTVSDGTLAASDSFLLTVIDGVTLAGWRLSHFQTPDNTGDAADLADPDKDGLKNLIEFAIGLNPKSGASMQLPQAQRIGGNLVITFIEPAGISGITYGAEWSPTIEAASWLPVTDTGSGGTHTFSVPTTDGIRKLMRLKVTNP